MTREFGWSRTALSGAVSLGGVLAALVAPLIGPVLDRQGSRLVLCAAVLVNGIALMLLSLTGSLGVFYLLFCLGHGDAWPAGDLAVQEAARMPFALKMRPTTKEMGPLAEPWRPLRGVAACLLWSYYRALKRRDAAPVQPTAEKVNGRRA